MSPSSRNRPYDISYHVGNYYFNTDHGLTYSCRFSDVTESILPDQLHINFLDFEFFANGDPVPDPRLSETLINLMDTWTDNKSDVIMYVCDPTDGRAQARQALFARWGRQVADRYDHQPVNVTAGGIAVHGGFFTSKEFLYRDELDEVVENAPRILVDKFGG